MDHILLVGENLSLLAQFSESLKESAFQVTAISEFKVEWMRIQNIDCDLVVLVATGRESETLELCRLIRSILSHEHLAIIYVYNKNSESDIVATFNAGADAYLPCPLTSSELKAWVVSLLKRFKDKESISAGPFELSLRTRTLRKNGQAINLTRTEFELFSLLFKNKGKVLGRQFIVNEIWNGVDSGSLNVHLMQLRRKVEDNPSDPDWIITCRGLGLMFQD